MLRRPVAGTAHPGKPANRAGGPGEVTVRGRTSGRHQAGATGIDRLSDAIDGIPDRPGRSIQSFQLFLKLQEGMVE
jgi:hypothetical protein